MTVLIVLLYFYGVAALVVGTFGHVTGTRASVGLLRAGFMVAGLVDVLAALALGGVRLAGS